jgi:hypothetical protein
MLRLARESNARTLDRGEVAARVDFVNAAEAVAEIKEVAAI